MRGGTPTLDEGCSDDRDNPQHHKVSEARVNKRRRDVPLAFSSGFHEGRADATPLSNVEIGANVVVVVDVAAKEAGRAPDPAGPKQRPGLR